MKMRLARWLRRVTLLAVAGSAVVAMSCSKDQSAGELTIVIQTDLAMPKDVNYVRIEVRSDGLPLGTDSPPPLHRNDYPINPGDPPELRVTIPATFAVYNNKGAVEPIAVRVTAGRDAKPRVLTDAITAVPADRNAMLRMYLQWLSDGSAVPVPAAADPHAATNACPNGQTNIAGECADAHVDVASLPNFDPRLVFGGPTAAAGVGFDVLSCFAAPEAVTTDAQCSFALPAGAMPDQLNVALELPPGSDGICNEAHCVVALDRQESPVGPAVGWFFVGGKVQLPPGVCTRAAAVPAMRVVFSRACSAKTPATPSCGPPSAATDCSIHGAVDADATAPPPAPPAAARVLTLGFAHTCTRNGGFVYCWGSNLLLQTGQSASGQVPESVAYQNKLNSVVMDVSAGVDSTCAISGTAVYCWGNDQYGELGTPSTKPPGTTDPIAQPTQVQGALSVPPVFIAVSSAAAASHACAFGGTGGRTVCWGSNSSMQLGAGNATTEMQPNMLDSKALALGDSFTCSVDAGGTVRCWGDNALGQLGSAAGPPQPFSMMTVTPSVGLSHDVVAGADFACALTNADTVSCWGNKQSGAVTGTKGSGPIIATDTGLAGVKKIAAGTDFVCAIVTNGSGPDTVHCWGDNAFGQLGSSNSALTTNEPSVIVPPPFDQIVAGGRRACVMARDRVACWGLNDSGQITGTPSTVPLPPTEVRYPGL